MAVPVTHGTLTEVCGHRQGMQSPSALLALLHTNKYTCCLVWSRRTINFWAMQERTNLRLWNFFFFASTHAYGQSLLPSHNCGTQQELSENFCICGMRSVKHYCVLHVEKDWESSDPKGQTWTPLGLGGENRAATSQFYFLGLHRTTFC